MDKEYSELSQDEKKIELYIRQKKTLDEFLQRGAISRAQYNKSLGDLTVKMGMQAVQEKLLKEEI